MRLQKSPLGLLSAFQLKVDGLNPPEFGNAVTPTVDVYDQYLLAQELVRVSSSFNLPIAGLNQGANVAVPAQKVWRILGFGLSANINVADAALQFDAVFSVSQPGLANAVPIATAQMVGSTANKNAGLYLARPLVLPAGWAIVTSIFARAAGPSVAVACVGSAVVHEFDL